MSMYIRPASGGEIYCHFVSTRLRREIYGLSVFTASDGEIYCLFVSTRFRRGDILSLHIRPASGGEIYCLCISPASGGEIYKVKTIRALESVKSAGLMILYRSVRISAGMGRFA